MIDAVVAFSIRHRLVVLLGVLAVAASGAWALVRTPIDAIPDLSENQVIVFASWDGRGPQEVEDQVTHPLAVHLQGLAGVKTVRAVSEFGWSMVHVVFDDATDRYFARARVLERLQTAGSFLPAGATPVLAPDATALGQILWYTLEGGGKDAGELRAIQDFEVRYALGAVEGVAEVASVGGFVREYQVDIDPDRLRALGLTLADVTAAVARSSAAVGGNAIARDGGELLVRGIAWLRGARDLEDVALASRGGVPILLREVATVALGPAPRRSVLEKDGGEAVGGVVVMRSGEDPLTVTERVHAKIAEIAPGLPAGVRIVPFYERTRLIEDATATLRRTLIEEIAIASLAVLLILGHVRSALLICATVPLAVLGAFLLMRAVGIASNIMSLSGIAISIGILIDAAIVMAENAHHRLHERFGGERVADDTADAVLAACRTVARPLVAAALITALPFVPVLALTGAEGKLFHPLAWTKLFALGGAVLLAITLVPALLPVLVRGRLRGAEENWIVRSLAAIYRPALDYCLRRPDVLLVLTGALMVLPIALLPRAFPYSALAAALPFVAVLPIALVARRKLLGAGIVLAVGLCGGLWLKPLGEEFMPPLDEGTILDMPVTAPHVSAGQARDDLVARDALLRAFPEVESVVGKAGRADTATDPSPLQMVETIVNLRPRDAWPRRRVDRADVEREAERVLAALAARGLVHGTNDPAHAAHAADAATARFDAFARELACRRLRARDDSGDGETPLAAAHGDAAATRAVASLDREILESGAPRLVAFLAEELLAGAAAPGVVAAVADERAPAFARDLHLHRADKAELLAELDAVVRMPGYGNIWTQPIINRVDMLATGARAPLEIKVLGSDRAATADSLATIQDLTNRVAAAVRAVPGAADVFAEQSSGKRFLEVALDRDRAARLGVSAADVNDVVEVAVGGKTVATTVEGRRRVAVRVRYARDRVDDGESIGRLPVAAGGEASPEAAGRAGADAPVTATVPLADVASIRVADGPSRIESENGSLRGRVHASVQGRDLEGFVAAAQRAVAAAVAMPEGFHIEWSGRYEQQLHARRTLAWIVPAVLLLVLLILQLTYRDVAQAGIMALAVPGAIAGGALFQALVGAPFSVAVCVGYIACFGMASGTAIVMLVYLREAIDRRGGLAAIASESELTAAVMDGAVKRLRPKLLTEGAMILGLVPMLFATGAGAEVMQPMAAPILGGILVADEVIDLLVPVLFHRVALRRWRRGTAAR